MKVYAFDVDETLNCSLGPISFEAMEKLRNEGNIVGLCGNWAMVVSCPEKHTPWHKVVSFFGPVGVLKYQFLEQLMKYIPAQDYVMVGNIKGVSGTSDDMGAALRANWRFIKESDFAAGQR